MKRRRKPHPDSQRIQAALFLILLGFLVAIVLANLWQNWR